MLVPSNRDPLIFETTAFTETLFETTTVTESFSITTAAVDTPPSSYERYQNLQCPHWSASENDALLVVVSKNRERGSKWKQIVREMAELGYDRSEQACKDHHRRLTTPPTPKPTPTPTPTPCLCGACNNREYGSTAWRLVEGRTCCKPDCWRPQHPSNYKNCAVHRDPTIAYGDGNSASERVQLEADIRRHLVASNTDLDSQRYTHFTSIHNGVQIDLLNKILAQAHRCGAFPGHIRPTETPEVWTVRADLEGLVNGHMHCINKFGRSTLSCRYTVKAEHNTVFKYRMCGGKVPFFTSDIDIPASWCDKHHDTFT